MAPRGKGRGGSTSCGCKRVIAITTHGDSMRGERSYLYSLWRNIVNRCYGEPTLKRYWNYAGIGISVCDRWRTSFENFRDDVLQHLGHRPSAKHSFDRVDPFGNYELFHPLTKELQVRWATDGQQKQNTREASLASLAVTEEVARQAEGKKLLEGLEGLNEL